MRRYLGCVLVLCQLGSVQAGTLATADLGAGIYKAEPLKPLLLIHNLDRDKVALGEKLFNDTRLSTDNSVSCASCHNLKTAGVDRLPHSPGVNKVMGDVNSPTVYNSAYNIAQFWDGRANSLEAQAAGPVHNPKEMASNWAEVLAKLNRDEAFVAAFEAVYPDGLSGPNIQDAIATFERTLITVDAPFDRYLRGEEGAISDKAKQGYSLFKSYGCAACHQGMNVGGNMYQKLGAMGDYFSDRGDVTTADMGRFNVSGVELDRHVFKVPSLRLVALTPPYFHDGSVPTLQEAIEKMAKYQLGRDIPPQDLERIIAFLHTLVGQHPRLEQ